MKPSKKLWLSNELMLCMVNEADSKFPLETGGVLMGYQAENNDLVVTELIGAGQNAVHRRFSFEPDQEYQISCIASIYKRTNGNITYLGDWHTHPTSSSNLSIVDKNTLTKIAMTEASQNNHPVMSILGGKPQKWTWNSVQFSSGQLRPWLLSSCKHFKIDNIFY